MAATLSGIPKGIPGYLSQQPGLDQLTNYQQALPGYYDTSAYQQAGQAYNRNFATRAEAGFDAQSRAAQNRAMQSGGRVGSSFAKGGLMLGLGNNLNSMNLDYAKMAAQYKAMQGNAAGQVAGQIANYGQNQQGMISQYDQGNKSRALQAQQLAQQKALAAAQMYQQNQQFGQSLDLQRDQFNFGKTQYANQQNQQQAGRQMAALGPMPAAYSGVGMTAQDAMNGRNQQDWLAQQQNYARFY